MDILYGYLSQADVSCVLAEVSKNKLSVPAIIVIVLIFVAVSISSGIITFRMKRKKYARERQQKISDKDNKE